MKLKHACVDAGQYGLNVTPENYVDEGVRLIRTSDIATGHLDDEGIYVTGPVEPRHRLEAGDLLLSRSGTIGRAYLTPEVATGSTFAGFLVRFRPREHVSSRYLYYVTLSQGFQQQVSAGAVASTIQNFNADRYANVEIPDVSADEQRRIADFLDYQVARMDGIVEKRARQAVAVDLAFQSIVLDGIRGAGVDGARRESGLRWLGSVPADWPVLPVSTQFGTVLGKMLDERQQTGERRLPYLRNTNVQWDRIDTDDLKLMDIAPSEYARCTVRAGDLLICEGGQPGRAAIWDGSIELLGFQKALHRARSRGRSTPRWLLHCLRAAVAMNAFAGENGVTTIGHLTGEQLRAQRFPFPDPQIQADVTALLDTALLNRQRASEMLGRSNVLLTEYKQSLITAAVTGAFDVTTASTRSIPA